MQYEYAPRPVVQLRDTRLRSLQRSRTLSQVHERDPYLFRHSGTDLSVRYLPAESDSGLFGGNSNWRGPVWLPVNFLIIESPQKFHHYYGNEFKVECPSRSGTFVTLNEAANEIARRLKRSLSRCQRSAGKTGGT